MSHNSFTCPHCGSVNALNTNQRVDISKVACSACGKQVEPPRGNEPTD